MLAYCYYNIYLEWWKNTVSRKLCYKKKRKEDERGKEE
jgi:hypothetical protein